MKAAPSRRPEVRALASHQRRDLATLRQPPRPEHHPRCRPCRVRPPVALPAAPCQWPRPRQATRSRDWWFSKATHRPPPAAITVPCRVRSLVRQTTPPRRVQTSQPRSVVQRQPLHHWLAPSALGSVWHCSSLRPLAYLSTPSHSQSKSVCGPIALSSPLGNTSKPCTEAYREFPLGPVSRPS